MSTFLMEWGSSLAAAFALLAASIMLHYKTMIWTRSWLIESGMRRRTGALLGMATMICAQLVSILLYAITYLVLDLSGGIGSLEGEIQGGFIDPLYFSLMSYTTLGVGDIYPLGGFRIISGIEALNGFALIGWTASFAYTLLRDGWNEQREEP